MRFDRRTLLRGLATTALCARARLSRASAGSARRVIFFYFPDGVPGPSQDGDPSAWHATGSERQFTLGAALAPLESRKQDCVFFSGLSMGATDAGSHPGGAKKLLTGVDGGGGQSLDQFLAQQLAAPHRHLYLGAMANQNNASGDKHISYPAAGQTVRPDDDPQRAFRRLFGGGVATPPGTPDSSAAVIEGALADLGALRNRVGGVDAQKLELHMDALAEVRQRIDTIAPPEATCNDAPPSLSLAPPQDQLHVAERFGHVLTAQIDVMVQAMACGLTRVGVLQASHHTSELIMSRIPGSAMHDPGFDMRSHQASHYGPRHDLNAREYRDFLAQRRWFVGRFAYLLEQLAARPEGAGTMLDNSIVLLCTEVCDGNTHSHDNMPFVLAGGAGGCLPTGRYLNVGWRRHGDLLASIAHAAGVPVAGYGQDSGGPIPGLLRG